MTKMRPKVVNQRIESFAKRFGTAHLYLAYHAAFPLALTPDLLYRLWANFQRDTNGEVLNIPWIAVADLLLSSLCNEVGHELYEMDLSVRNLLLNYLQKDKKFGQERINELSNFLLDYVRQKLQSDDPDTHEFAQTQRWVALAYTQPNQASRELALVLSKLDLKDKAELVRLTSLIETFAEPLAEFQALLKYSYGMGKFIRGDLEATKAILAELIDRENQIRILGFSLPIPEQILIWALLRNTRLSTIGVIAAIAAIALAVGTIYNSYTHQPKQEPVLTKTNQLLPPTTSNVRSVAVSSDGRTIASGNDLGQVQLWDMSTEKLRSTCSKTGTQIIQSVAFSPSGTIVASGESSDAGIRICDLNGKLISVFANSQKAYSLVFSPNGQNIISGHADGMLKIWNLDGKLVRSIKAHSSGNVVSVVISSDGKTVASRAFRDDSGIKVWNISTGSLRTIPERSAGGVNSLAISPNRNILASYSGISASGEKQVIHIWDLETGKAIGTLDVGIDRPYAIALSSDGQTLAVGGYADQIEIWDVSTQEKRDTLNAGNPIQTYSLAFTPDSKTIVSAGHSSSGGSIILWKVKI